MSRFLSGRTALKPKLHTRRRISGHHGELPHLLQLFPINPRIPGHPPCLNNRSGHLLCLRRWHITLRLRPTPLPCSTNHLSSNRRTRPFHQSRYNHTSPMSTPKHNPLRLHKPSPLLPPLSPHRLPPPVCLVFIPRHKHQLSRGMSHSHTGRRVWRSLLKGPGRGYTDLQPYPLRLHILLSHCKHTHRQRNSNQHKFLPPNCNLPNHIRRRYKYRSSPLPRLTRPRRTPFLERRRCPLNNQERSPRRLC